MHHVSANFSCVPWDLPYLVDDMEICPGESAKDFKDTLQKIDASEHCPECLDNCESVLYLFSIDTFATDPVHLCKNADIFGTPRQ